MKISSDFDSGNIILESAKAHDDIRLKIRNDSNSEFLQWFHFRLQGTKGQECKLKIINAGESKL